MNKKYKVTQEFIDVFKNWNDEHKDTNGVTIISNTSLDELPDIVINWSYKNLPKKECNNRFGAIINWINGEDVFEVEVPHKFIVRSEIPNVDGDYVYVLGEYAVTDTVYSLNDATKFNTEREAQEWANSHQVVVEIDEAGNEVG